jgi:hypothetical protein
LGRYDYQGTLFNGGADLATTFDGEDSFAAALIGYQFRARSLFIKLFAGLEAEDQWITRHDPNNAVQGSAPRHLSPSTRPMGRRSTNIGV